MTATLNKVLPFLALLMPKSTMGPEEGRETPQDISSTEQAKKKGKSIDKTMKKGNLAARRTMTVTPLSMRVHQTLPLQKGVREHMVSCLRCRVRVKMPWARSQSGLLSRE